MKINYYILYSINGTKRLDITGLVSFNIFDKIKAALVYHVDYWRSRNYKRHLIVGKDIAKEH